uniref:Uncharacterized protein n=1 Tax=Peronospora matthiolae TaxID=2874970 RepID=A0AAV1VD92_9STRA
MRSVNIIVCIASILRRTHGETLATAGLYGMGGEMSSPLTDVTMKVDKSLAEALVDTLPHIFRREFPTSIMAERDSFVDSVLRSCTEQIHEWLKEADITDDALLAAFKLRDKPPSGYEKFVAGYKSVLSP